MKLKNQTIRIAVGSYNSLLLETYTKDKNGVLTFDKQYKLNNRLNGVDLDIAIPKGCRKEYATITKIN